MLYSNGAYRGGGGGPHGRLRLERAGPPVSALQGL